MFTRNVVLGFLGGVALMGAGFLMGSQLQPQQVDSQLADAQLVAQDVSVRYVGYNCGDDHATVISREMPNIITECKESVLLSPDAEFQRPPHRTY